ncbi:hypothetical protein TSAR_002960 [Trichomalopsis sarcophagae]|uniref:Uncharacterized protein n=1 Tax=Trichomalopsis sarcophagae TaxID=543379 RepID=A0A232FNM7_9HYME|nr:hypothetical protein TSAR_002960 [Trichomalopsis sarcophagae]
MFSRKLLLLFGVVLFIAIVAANTDEKDFELEDFELEDSEEGLDPLEERILKTPEIIKIIRRLIRLIARKCLRIAIRNCKENWPDIKALAKCAKEYLKETKGRCIIE